MLSRPVLDRDDVAALAIAVIAVPALTFFGAFGPAKWPGVGVCLPAALAVVAFLVPAIQRRLRSMLAAYPALYWAIPACFAVYGAAATLLFGSGGFVNVVAWPACIVAAVVALGKHGASDPPPLRLLGAGLALAILAGIWDRDLQIRVPGDARLGLGYLSCMALALFLFVVARPRRMFDTRFGLGARDVGLALAATAALAFVAVPIGLGVGFLEWHPRWVSIPYGMARLFGLVLFVGLAEEMLFRGVVQDAFIRLTSVRTGWVLASVLFGAMHLAKHFPPLNWPYAALATVAGLAYGWVYLRTGRLGAAALTHGLVNWIWGTWLGA
jgi:membrane protease YdiL (CAAX protease family)